MWVVLAVLAIWWLQWFLRSNSANEGVRDLETNLQSQVLLQDERWFTVRLRRHRDALGHVATEYIAYQLDGAKVLPDVLDVSQADKQNGIDFRLQVRFQVSTNRSRNIFKGTQSTAWSEWRDGSPYPPLPDLIGERRNGVWTWSRKQVRCRDGDLCVGISYFNSEAKTCGCIEDSFSFNVPNGFV